MTARQPDLVDRFTLAFGVGLAALATVMGGDLTRGAAVVGLNVGIGLLALWLLPRWRAAGGARRFFGVALPLLAFYLFYRETVLVLGAADVTWLDPVVARLEWTHWERAAQTAGSVVLGELSAFGYMAYVPLLLLIAAALLAADSGGMARTAETYVRHVCIAWAVCYVVFLLVPVLGPRVTFPSLQETRLGTGPFSALARANQEHGMIRGAAFPSAHVAATLVAMCHAWRGARRVFWIALGPGLALVGGAIYLGYHYAVDVAAGAGIGALVVAFDPAIGARIRRAPAGGADP